MAVTLREIVQAHPESQPTEHPHIERIPGFCGGQPKICGHRIPVWIIAGWHSMEMTVDQILEMYPQLTPGEVYDALSYYYDHKEEVDLVREQNSEENVRARLGIK